MIPTRRQIQAIPGPAWAALLALAFTAAGCGRVPRVHGPLEHDAYVWQRDWSTNVIESVAVHGPAFRRLVILGAEVSWRDGQPRVVRVPFRLPEPGGTTNRPLAAPGIALRIGPFPGPFLPGDASTRWLAGTVRSLLEEARRLGFTPSELQLDFDCAESRLEGYRVWVEALRREAAPVPLFITALPSWLKRSSFAGLARSADGFILQVHSIARPRNAGDPFQLCDPEAALRAVESAARVGVPFRVALPTYGYLVAFGANGEFLGASAEGPPPQRPAQSTLHELSADPAAMSRLVMTWTGDRPSAMRGLIWYRLPVAGDRFNWRWPTLGTVMTGHAPRSRLEARARESMPGLFDIELQNSGDADRSGPVGIRAHWTRSSLVGRDGIRGFATQSGGLGDVLFTNAICRLRAGDTAGIGWIRLDSSVALTLEVLSPPALRD